MLEKIEAGLIVAFTFTLLAVYGLLMAIFSLGFVGGLFLAGHLQRWQDARCAKRMETERASKNY